MGDSPKGVAVARSKVRTRIRETELWLHGSRAAGSKGFIGAARPGIFFFFFTYLGYQAPNLRKLADKIAAAGFLVAVPDFFHGEPYDPNNTSRPKDAWLNDHRPEKGFEEAKPLIKDLKSKGFSAIGVAGFCWGAKVAIELAKLKNFVQATAILHPSFVTLDDIKEVKVPLGVFGAELDKQYPRELVNQFEEVLRANKIDHFVKIYLGVKHGFTLRYDVQDDLARKRAKEAHKDLLNWFTKHVK